MTDFSNLVGAEGSFSRASQPAASRDNLTADHVIGETAVISHNCRRCAQIDQQVEAMLARQQGGRSV